MPDLWIVNSSPIITLAKIERLDLLDHVLGRIGIPHPVVEEIMSGPSSDPARRAIESGWAERLPGTPQHPVAVEWGLGAGETSVLGAAVDRRALGAVLDDRAARSAARTLGVRIIGTLGIIVEARRRNLIASARGVLDELRRSGFYVDERFVARVLAATGVDTESDGQ